MEPEQIRRECLKGKKLDLLIVCAPCQPFSQQNRKRKNDKRADLILEAARFADALKPRLIFFENVPGLAASSRAKLLAKLEEMLGPNYVLGEPEKVDAADFGVPQRRMRCIMLARYKGAPPGLPEATTPEGKRMTVRRAIGRLRRLKSGQSDPKDFLHAARQHQPSALKRLAEVPKDGGTAVRCRRG